MFFGFGTTSPTVNPTENVVIIDPNTSDDTYAGQTEETGVSIKESLSAYSWDELGTIATRIEQCTSSDEALVVAQEYNLIDASGTYYNATKSIDMLDGTTLKVRLVGIWHDNGDTVSGKTGLSFLADEVAYHQPMSSNNFMEGGWERSKLRAWLSSDLSPLFPTEVSSHFVSTYKRTNNVGVSHSVDSVTETIDTLWVPSIVELAGPLDWVYSSHPEYRDEYNAIFNAEGTQYPAFAQIGINTDGINTILKHDEEWWTRSTAPASSRSRFVGPDGNPAKYGDADTTRGVVVGFCF